MATESVAATTTQPEAVTVNVVDARKPVTTRTSFKRIPVIKDHLFEVRPGLDIYFAISEANCLAESIDALATDAVDGGMSAEAAYLVAFAADAIGGLLDSIEGAHMLGKVQS
jgi:hypothetical protein